VRTPGSEDMKAQNFLLVFFSTKKCLSALFMLLVMVPKISLPKNILANNG